MKKRTNKNEPARREMTVIELSDTEAAQVLGGTLTIDEDGFIEEPDGGDCSVFSRR